MSNALTGKPPSMTYKDWLQISNGNSGIDGTLRPVADGEGTDSPLHLSNAKVQIKPTTDGDIFEIVDASGTVMFTVNTSTKEVKAGSGVKFVGDGSSLSGITNATGGVSNTGSTNIVADSNADGSGDITLSIGSTEIIRITNNGSGDGGSWKLLSLNEDKLATLTSDEIAYVNVDGVAKVQDADGTHPIVLADKWGEMKGGLIFDGSNDYVDIPDQSGIKFVSFVVEDVATSGTVGIGTLGANLGIQSVDGVVTLGSGFTNTTIYVNGIETTQLSGGRDFVSFVCDEVSANSGKFGYDGSNYGKFTLLGYRFGNIQFTADEVSKLYSNGLGGEVPYELKDGGAVTYESDFSSGTDGFNADNGSVNGNIDGIGGEDDVLKFTVDSSPSTVHRARKFSALAPGKSHRITGKIYIPSSNAVMKRVRINNGSSVYGYTEVATTDAWAEFTVDVENGGVNIHVYLQGGDASGNVIFNGNGSDVFYAKDIKAVQLGISLELKDENAGSNGWVGELGGETIVANSSGSPIAISGKRDGKANIPTTATELVNSQKAGTILKGIIVETYSGSPTTVSLGTTTSANELLNGESFTSGDFITINKFSGSERSLYAKCDSGAITMILIYEEV